MSQPSRRGSLRNAGGLLAAGSSGAPLSPDSRSYRGSSPVSPASSTHSRLVHESRDDVQSALDGLLSGNGDGGSSYGYSPRSSKYRRGEDNDRYASSSVGPPERSRGVPIAGGVPPPTVVGIESSTSNIASPGNRYITIVELESEIHAPVGLERKGPSLTG